MLTVTATHLKEGYLRRNGLPRSDKATLTEHWIRNGDFLTVVIIIYDPVYLRAVHPPTDYELTSTSRSRRTVRRGAGNRSAKGDVPHYLPGANPFMTEFAVRHGLPLEATRGGGRRCIRNVQKTKTRSPLARRRAGPFGPARKVLWTRREHTSDDRTRHTVHSVPRMRGRLLVAAALGQPAAAKVPLQLRCCPSRQHIVL